MIHRFEVGRLRCAVVSDGQPEPPFEPPLSAFFTPECGVPEPELTAAIAAEDPARTTLTCGYNCLVVETIAGLAIIDTGLGARFFGYGPAIEPLVGRLGDRLGESDGERLLCVGDSFYDPLQLGHPAWCTAWDHDQARSVTSRRRLLARAADEGLVLHAYHLPFPGLGVVSRTGQAYAWRPVGG